MTAVERKLQARGSEAVGVEVGAEIILENISLESVKRY